MKNYLIEKYEGYIAELEYELEINKLISVQRLAVLKEKLECYREILTDLKMLPDL